MNFSMLAAAFLKGMKRYRQFILSSGDERLILPVTPEKYSVRTAQSNKIFDILDAGEALIFGNKKLQRLKFSSFFPDTKHEYPFVVGDDIAPSDAVNLLIKWKESKSPVRVIITDSPVNLVCGIMEFDYREKDGSHDIYYEVNLTEYRDLNVPQAEYQKQVDEQTGLKDRPENLETATQGKMIKNSRDALELSKACYGDFDHVETFKAQNNLARLLLTGGRRIVAKKPQGLSTNYVGNYEFQWLTHDPTEDRT